MTTPTWPPLLLIDRANQALTAAHVKWASGLPSAVGLIDRQPGWSLEEKMQWSRLLSQVDRLQATLCQQNETAAAMDSLQQWQFTLNQLAHDMRQPWWRRWWRGSLPKRLVQARVQTSQVLGTAQQLLSQTKATQEALMCTLQALEQAQGSLDAVRHADLLEVILLQQTTLQALAGNVDAHVVQLNALIPQAQKMGNAMTQEQYLHTWSLS